MRTKRPSPSLTRIWAVAVEVGDLGSIDPAAAGHHAAAGDTGEGLVVEDAVPLVHQELQPARGETAVGDGDDHVLQPVAVQVGCDCVHDVMGARDGIGHAGRHREAPGPVVEQDPGIAVAAQEDVGPTVVVGVEQQRRRELAGCGRHLRRQPAAVRDELPAALPHQEIGPARADRGHQYVGPAVAVDVGGRGAGAVVGKGRQVPGGVRQRRAARQHHAVELARKRRRVEAGVGEEEVGASVAVEVGRRVAAGVDEGRRRSAEDLRGPVGEPAVRRPEQDPHADRLVLHRIVFIGQHRIADAVASDVRQEELSDHRRLPALREAVARVRAREIGGHLRSLRQLCRNAPWLSSVSLTTLEVGVFTAGARRSTGSAL